MVKPAFEMTSGTILGGKYRVERVLGQGGMGAVLLAYHADLDHHVAIKVLVGDMVNDPEVVARFTREARAAAKLQSDHVARVSDVGRFDAVGPYMVMEYLQGVDLSQLLQERGPLPTSEAVDYVLEALDAIAEAHAIGIVHRDLKPSNLFLADRTDGTKIIKVLDFGISKVETAEHTPQLTSQTAIIGSPAYMSPEQLKASRDVDARADVWSLGIVLYEMLLGRLPFEGENVGALIATIFTEAPLPLRPQRPDIPEELEQTILRCLQKDRSMRYSGVAELARALAAFGSGRASRQVERAVALGKKERQLSSPMIETRVKPPVAEEHETQRAWQTLRDPPSKRSLVIVGIVGAAIAVLIAGISIAVMSKEAIAPVPASSSIATAPASTSISIPPLTSAPIPSATIPSAAPSASSVPAAARLKPAPSTTSTSFLDRQR